MSICYVVLDNSNGIPVWNEKAKIFNERNDAIKYFHELMTSDEVRGWYIPVAAVPDLNKKPYEQGPIIILESWIEW